MTISDSAHFHRLWRVSLRRVSRYPLRSSLLILCAAIGVAGVIATTNYAAGGRARILAQVERLGTRLINVTAERSVNVADRARTGDIVTTLREEDYFALQREFDEFTAHSAIVSRSMRLKGAGQSRNATVFGVEPAYFSMKAWPIADGEIFDESALRQSSRVVLLGASVARDLFGDGDIRGETLFINRVPFEVLGRLASRGTGLDGIDEDEQVFIPLTTAMQRLLSVEHYNGLLFEVSPNVDIRVLTESIAGVMNERHATRPGRESDFKVRNAITLIDAELASARRLGFLTAWISLATLLLAGVGILAMAWIATRDRIREIGTLRALGAERSDIFRQFALEASLLALIGTLVGWLLGWAASVLLERITGLPYLFDVTTAVVATLIALAVNVTFACWPARKASQADPIWALRQS